MASSRFKRDPKEAPRGRTFRYLARASLRPVQRHQRHPPHVRADRGQAAPDVHAAALPVGPFAAATQRRRPGDRPALGGRRRAVRRPRPRTPRSALRAQRRSPRRRAARPGHRRRLLRRRARRPRRARCRGDVQHDAAGDPRPDRLRQGHYARRLRPGAGQPPVSGLHPHRLRLRAGAERLLGQADAREPLLGRLRTWPSRATRAARCRLPRACRRS